MHCSSTLNINTEEAFLKFVSKNRAVLFYFSTMSCAVGENLEPKVKNLLTINFPKIKFFTIDINFSKKIAAKHSAFVEPTILVFFEGKETIRRSRNISVMELENAINRPYKLIFE